jgi:Reverse transcriptase (RNA-dependent DNA polymerase)
LEKFQTWELVDIPKNSNIVGCWWVFRLKHDAARNIVKYQARIIAKGFTQQPRVDFRETFAPVTKLASIQSTIALAVTHNWELHQMDVKSAYLNGDLEETIFMDLSPGYTPPGSTGKVCKLKKSIYGLKQAGRQWYQKLSNCFDRIGLTKSTVDHTVFYSCSNAGTTIICCSTNDLMITASLPDWMRKIKEDLNSYWEMTDLGELHWLLGMEVKRDRSNWMGSISQMAYIDHICEKFNLQDAKPLSTPLDPGNHLSKSQSPSTLKQIDDMCGIPYHEAVGSLMYAVVGT